MVKHLVFAIAITAILSCGQNEPLTNYEPKSTQEQALKGILLDFEDGVNTRDSKKIGNLIHEKASMMTGRERKILSRAEYIKVLPKRLAENPPIALGKPKITISGDKAEVKIYMARGDFNSLVVFNMKLENNEAPRSKLPGIKAKANKWYIQGWKY